MAYDLITNGIADFSRIDWAFSQRKVSRDPLSGVMDGSNTVFFTNYAPILTSGSLLVYVNNSLVGGVADYDTGEVTLTSVPALQPYATYSFTPYTLTQQLSILIGGFYEMESRWPRRMSLRDAAGNAATEDSANIYVDYGGADPFTDQSEQRAFFIACCRYSYLLMQLTGAAITDFDWRETVRGMGVTKSKRPQNLDLALKAAENGLKEAMYAAQDKWYPDGSHMGGYISNPMTLQYVYSYEWQVGAKLDQNSGQRSNRTFLPLNV